jgi:hypothetical protein
MRSLLEKIMILKAGLVVVALLAFSAVTQAEEVGVDGASETAIAVVY